MDILYYLSRFKKSSLFTVVVLLGFLLQGNQGFSQAVFSTARHETLTQQDIDVTFTGSPVTAAGTTAGWTVTVGGTSLVPTGITLLNSTTVEVTFDASSVPGHGASQPFVKPGETVTVQYVGGGGLTAAGGVTGLATAQTSQNNHVPTCSDISFKLQGTASGAGPDFCSPVDTGFYTWIYEYPLLIRNSSTWSLTGNRLYIGWNDGLSSATILFGFLSDGAGVPNAASYNASSNFGPGIPSITLAFRTGFNTVTGLPDGTTDAFSYPDQSGKCNFSARVIPLSFDYGYNCTGLSSQISTQFNSYDYDDQNTGTLSMTNSVPPTTATSNLVCIGSNVGVRFTDTSTFNCIGDGTNLPTPAQGALPQPINNQQRWIRIIYGGANAVTGNAVASATTSIPNIEVGGVPVTDANGNLLPAWYSNPLLPGTYSLTNPDNIPGPMARGYVPTGAGGLNVPDANGVIQMSSTATVSYLVSQLITTSSPVGQVVGQRFYITLQYWGVCNPYNSTTLSLRKKPVEISTNYVEIISKPPTPISLDKSLCQGTSVNPPSVACGSITVANQALSFEVTAASVTGSTGINWYFGDPALGGVLLTSTYGANCRFFRTGDLATTGAQGTMRAALIAGTAGSYSLWATQLNTGTNSCESLGGEVKIVINPQPAVSNQTPTSICSRTATGINFGSSTNGTAASTYNVTVLNLNGMTVSAGGAAVANGLAPTALADDAFLNTSGTQKNAVYTVTPVSALGCPGSSFTVTIPVDPQPSVSNQTPLVCSDIGVGVNFGTSSGVAAATYNVIALNLNGLTVSAGGPAVVNGLANTALADDAFTNTTAANVDVTYTVVPVAATGCLGNSFTVIVTVRPEPIVVNMTPAAICSDAVVGVNFNASSGGSVAASTYNVTVLNLNGLTISGGGPIVANGLANTALANDAFTNTTAAQVNVIYTVVPVSAAGCLGDPFSVTVPVNPKPVVNAQLVTAVCSGLPTGVNFAASVNGLAASTYNVTALNLNGLTIAAGAPAVVNGLSNTALADDAYTNTGNTQVNVIYTVTPVSAGGCPGNSFLVTVPVDPQPVVANQTPTTCSNTTIGVNFNSSTSVAAATYNVTALNLNGLTIFAGGPAVANGLAPNALANDAFTNTTGSPVDVTYTVVPVSAAGCLGNSFSVTVTVNPIPIGSNDNAAAICSGQPVGYNLQTQNINANNSVPSNFSWLALVDNTNVSGESLSANTASTIGDVLVNTSGSDQTVTYTVTPTSVAGCPGASFTVAVVVSGPSVDITGATTQGICSGNTLPLTVNETYSSGTFTSRAWSGTFDQNFGAAPALVTLTNAQLDAILGNHLLQNPTFNSNGLGAGVSGAYVLTYTASTTTGCSATDVITINVSQIGASISHGPTAAASLTTLTDTVCNGVNVFLNGNPTGGTGSYTAPGGHLWSIVSSTTGTVTITDVMSAAAKTTQTPTFNFNNTTNAPNTIVLRYSVTDNQGCNFTTGAGTDLSLTVNPTPTVDAITSQEICAGTSTTTVTFASAFGVTGTTFDWANSNTAIGLAASATNATSIPAFTTTNTTNAQISGTITVTPKANGCTGTPVVFTIKVDAKPVLATYNIATICSGTAFALTPANGSPTAATIVPTGTTYTWVVSAITPTAASVNATAQPVAQTSIGQTLTNSTNVTQTVDYLVSPLSGAVGACPGVGFHVLVPVAPRPNIDNRTINLCSGTGAFNVAPVNGINSAGAADATIIVPAGTTYTWPVPTVSPGTLANITNAAASTGTPASVTQNIINKTNVPQTVTYTVIPSAGAGPACAGTPFTVTVRLDPRPAIDNRTQTICSGTVFTIAPVNGFNNGGTAAATVIVPTGTTYTWTVTSVTPGGLPAVTGHSAQPVAQANISQTLTNTTNAVQTVKYTVTPTSGDLGACQGSTFTVDIAVSPKPAIDDRTQTICSGSGFTISPVNGVNNAGSASTAVVVPTGTTYTWTVTSITPDVGSVNATAQATPQANISQALTNSKNVTEVVRYQVTPANGTCIGTAFNVDVTVSPKPAIPAQTLTACSGLPATLTLTDGVPTAATILPAGTTFTWGLPTTTGGPGGVTGASAGTAQASFSQTLTNSTGTSQTATYSLTPTAGTCVGTAFNVVITVNPLAAVNNLTPSLCSDLPGGTTKITNLQTYNTSISATAVSFAWYKNYNLGTKVFSNPIGASETAYNVTTGEQLFVQVTDGPGCIGAASVTFTVNPTPLANPISGPTNVCQDATNIIVYQVTPHAGSTYAWSVPTGPTQFVLAATPNPTDFFVLLQFPNIVTSPGLNITMVETTAAGCIGATSTKNIQVDGSPPPITIVGPASVCANETGVVYSVALLASTTYAWTVPIGASIIGGQGSETITVNFGSISGNVAVVPSTTSGCAGTPDSKAVVVNQRPDLSNSLDQAVCSKTASGITLAAESFSPVPASTYNVTSVTFSAPGLTPIVGPTTGTGLTSAALALDKYENKTGGPIQVRYTVVPVSIDGCPGSPEIVTLTVNPEPVLSGTLDKTICSRSASGIILSVATGSFPASTYNITLINNNGLVASAGAPVTGTGFNAGEIVNDAWINTTSANVDVEYTISPVSVSPISCVGDPVIVRMTITPEPVGNAIVKVTRCSDTDVLGAYYTLSTSGVAATGFTISTNPHGLTQSTGTVSAGTGKTATELIDDAWTNTGLIAVDVDYLITPLNGTCAGTPFTISVTINPEPVGTPITQVSRCSDTALGGTYTLSTSASSVAASSYNITILNPGALIFSGATPVAATGNSASILTDDSWTNIGLSAAVITYNITPVSAAGCVGNTYAVSVSIDPEPVGNPIVQVSRCSDTALGAAYTLSGNGSSIAAVTYNITVTNPDALPFSGLTPVAATNNVSTVLTDDSWTNTGLLPSVVTYNVTPVSAGGCLGDPYAVSVSIDPEPVGTLIVQVSRCSDTVLGAAYTLSNTATSVTASTYNITVNSGGLVFSGATPITATGNAANILIDDKWTNTGLLPVVVTYTVTPVSSGGCLGDPYSVSVSVDPEPVGNPITQVSRCSDTVLGAAYTLSSGAGSVAAATYNIAVSAGGLTFSGATPVAATGNIANILIDDSWTNTGLLPVVVTYTVTPVSAGGCLGDPYAVSVSVDPEPVGAPITTASRCSDTVLGAAYTLSTTAGSVTASTYNITVNNGGLTFSGATPIAATGNAANVLIDDSWTNTGLLTVMVTYTVTPVSAGGCLGDPYAVSVNVDPEPVGTPIVQVSRCSDTVLGAAYTLTGTASSIAVASFNISVSSGALIFSGATPIAATGNAGNILIDDSWTNTGLTAVVVTYTVTPVGTDGCLGDPYPVKVSIDPEPVGNPITQVSRCSDVALGAAYMLTSNAASVAAATYNITVLNPGGLTFSGSTPVAATGNSASVLTDDSWTNMSLLSQIISYTITPVSAGGCLGDPYVVSVSIDPGPVGNAIVQVSRCSDTALGAAYTLSTSGSSVAAASYNITVNTGGLIFSGATPIAATGNSATVLLDDSWTNTGLLPIVVTYTVTPVSAGGCLGVAYPVSVSIDPEPVGDAIVQVTRCSDVVLGAGYTLSSSAASVAAASYNITVSAGSLTFSGATPVAATGNAANILVDDSWTNTSLAPVVVTYTVTPVSAGGCLGNPYAVNVTVDPEPVGIPITQVSRCSDTVLGAAYTLTSDPTSVTASSYNITVNANGLIFSGATPIAATGNAAGILLDDSWTNTGLLPVVVTYTVTPVSGGGCLGDPYSVSVSIDPEPVGTPITQVSRCSDTALGAAYTLSNTASSVAAATYNITVNANGLVFSGATPIAVTGNTSNVLIDDSWTNTGLLAVVVTYTVTPVSASGCLGNPYGVSVSVDPEPVGIPVTQVSRCSDTVLGASYTLTGSASSVAVASYNVSISSGGLIFSGATPATATGNAGNILVDDSWTNTGLVPVVVTYTVTPVSAGGCLGNPYAVSVSVDPEPVGNPITQVSRCSDTALGAAYTLSSNGASVAAATYNITVSSGALVFSGATPVAATGNTANVLIDDSWTNIGLAPVVVTYTITPVSAGGCLGDPYSVSVSVDPEPVGNPITQVSRCSDTVLGAAYTLSSNGASVAAATYNITVSSGGLVFSGATPVTATGNTANILIDDSWTNTGLVPVVVTYTVTPVSAGGCLGDPYVVKVSVDPEPVGNAITQVSRCSDTVLGGAYTLSGNPSSVAAATYNIVVNAGGLIFSGATPATATGNLGNILIDDSWANTGLAPVVVNYTVTPVSAGGCLGDPYSVSVSIDPEPVGVPIVQVSRCSDTVLGAAYTLTSNAASEPAVTYNITVSSGGLIFSGSTPVTPTGNAGNILLDDSWTNTGLLPVIVTYTVTPVSAGGCLGNPYAVSVSIDPEPVGTPITQVSRCSRAVLGVAYTLSSNAGSVTASTYNITVNPNGLTFSGATPIAPTGNTSGILVDDSWTNTGLFPVIVSYTITPVSAGGCLGDPYTVSVSVDPEPVGSNMVATHCSDEAFGPFLFLTTNGTSVPASTFNISVNANGLTFSGATPAAPTGNVAGILTDDKWTNITSLPVDVIYTVVPVSGTGCAGLPFLVTVTINPEPIGAPAVPLEVCSGTVLSFDLQTIINNTYPGGNSVAGNSVTSIFKYSVTSSPAAAGVSPGPNRNTASSSPITDTYVNTSNIDATITYTVTPFSSAGGCEGTPFDFVITVHPQPVGINVLDTRCSTTLSHNIQTDHINVAGGNGLASVFTYVFIPDPSNPSVVPTTPPPYDRTVASAATITDSFLNTTGSDAVVTYLITPYNAAHPGCAGNTFTYKVRISPKPQGGDFTEPQQCSNVPFTFNPQDVINDPSTTPAGNSVISTFTWTATYDPGIVVKTAGSGVGSISETLLNRTSSTSILNAYYVVIPTGGTCVGDPFTITVPVKPEPVVATNLNVTRCSGDIYGINLATVTGPTASVGAATYDITAVVNPDLIGTATTGTGLTLSAIFNNSFINKKATPLTVVYSVVPHASAGNGGCIGESKDIIFTINPEPVIQPQPAIDPVCSNNTNSPSIIGVILGTDGTSVNASSYRIFTPKQYSTDGGTTFSTTIPTGFTDVGNATVGTLGTSNLIRNDKYNNILAVPVIVRYTIVAKGPSLSGSCDGDPQDFDVTINPQPVLDPALVASICSGDKIDPTGSAFDLKSQAGKVASTLFIIRSVSAIGMTAGGTNAPVNVQINKDGIDSDTFINTTNAALTVTYSIAPISAAGCTGDDQNVVITVNPAPAVKPGLDAVVCSGAITGVVLKDNSPVSIAAATYKIMSVTSTGLVADPGNAVPNPVTATANVNYIKNDKFVNNTTDRLNVVYQVVPISAAGCNGPQVPITVTVEPTIITASINHAPNICSASPINIEFSSPTYANGAPTNPAVTFSYKAFTPVPSGITGFTSGNNLNEGDAITDILVNSTNGPLTIQYQITPRAATAANNVGCPGASELISVTVQPQPKVNAISDKTICYGDKPNLTLTSPTHPTVDIVKFTITSDAEPEILGATNDAVTLRPANYVIADVLTNTDVVTHFVDYHITPINVDATDAYICTGVVRTVRVTVNPKPIVSFGTASPTLTILSPSHATVAICSGDPVEIDFTTNTDVSSTLIKWDYAPKPNANVSGVSAGAGETLFQTLLNKSNTDQVVNYTVIPYYAGCAGDPMLIDVTVHPIPVVSFTSTKIRVCGGETLNILPNITTDRTLSSFKWTVTDVNGLGGVPLTGSGPATDPIIQTFVNNTDASALFIYEITPVGPGGCEGVPKTINISVGPTISVTPPDNQQVCEGTPVFLDFELTGQAPFNIQYTSTTSAGTTTTPVTKVGNAMVLKVTPTLTTTYRITSVTDGLGCSVNFTSPSDDVTVKVFKSVVAGFTANIPPFIGGNSAVTFTNTSTVLDPTLFRYEWIFGTDSAPTPINTTGVGPTFVVNYSRPGDQYVTLRVVNLAAEAAGVMCESTYSKKISVPLLPLVSDFTFDPVASCFPQTITITENKATGNVMSWKVIDSDGRIAAQSSAPLPTFTIPTPGVYTVTLQTSDSFTGQTAFSASKEFSVYANPVASFQARPTTLYVPDTELITANFSTGATDYEWQFGDGGSSTDRTPTYFYKIEGIYDIMLIAKNDHGGGVVCKDTLTQKVTAKQGGVTKVPNAFTPNTSGPTGGFVPNGSTDLNNDVFLPFVKGVEEFNMEIFDRWGNLIFESNNSNIGWDGYDKNGRIMQSGVYVFKLTLRLSDGQRTTQIGDITLIR